MPSPIHEHIISAFAASIYLVYNTLSQYFQDRISIAFNQDETDFKGDWVGSYKISDLAIEVTDNKDNEQKWILEAGFAESYKKLCEDAKLWLEGCRSVSTVCLVKFTEDPLYQCPTSFDDDLDQIPLGRKIFDKDVVLQGKYGPAIYKGYRCVGQISAVLETWTLGEDGIARRYGDCVDLLQPNTPEIQVQPSTPELGDFLDIPFGYNGTVRFTIEDFRRLLSKKIIRLAISRYQEMLIKRAKRMGDDPANREYQP
jgi:hypothetical protein